MTVKIHNVEYVTVAERVTACHADEGFSMISEEIFSIGDRHFVRIAIEVKGKQYIGSSEIKFGAKPNTPDGSSPLECAATSSLGRALGFAGYGSVESIASADEIVRSQSRQDAQETMRPSNDLAGKLKDLKVRAVALGIDDKHKWQSMLTNLDIEQVRGQAELNVIDSYLAQEEAARQQTAF